MRSPVLPKHLHILVSCIRCEFGGRKGSLINVFPVCRIGCQAVMPKKAQLHECHIISDTDTHLWATSLMVDVHSLKRM